MRLLALCLLLAGCFGGSSPHRNRSEGCAAGECGLSPRREHVTSVLGGAGDGAEASPDASAMDTDGGDGSDAGVPEIYEVWVCECEVLPVTGCWAGGDPVDVLSGCDRCEATGELCDGP